MRSVAISGLNFSNCAFKFIFNNVIQPKSVGAVASTKESAKMPIKGEKHPLNRKNVDLAPASSGVYALFTEHEVTYYGAARQGETIRDRLGRHLSGQHPPGRAGATAFSYEITGYPKSRESALLEEHRRSNQRLPRFNGISP
jgi:hypothetical protein